MAEMEGAKGDKGSCSNGFCQGVHQPSQASRGGQALVTCVHSLGGGSLFQIFSLSPGNLYETRFPCCILEGEMHSNPAIIPRAAVCFSCSKQRASCLSPRINNKSISCTQWHPESSYGLLLICLCVLLTALTAPVIRCHRGVFCVWLQDFLEPWRESKSQSVV